MQRLMFFIMMYPLASWGDLIKDNDGYFKLHQATGYYEQFVMKRCPSGFVTAQNILNSARESNLDTELTEKFQALKIEMSKPPSSVAKLESFRLSIHELQEHKGYNHSASWHDEIIAQCRKNLIDTKVNQ